MTQVIISLLFNIFVKLYGNSGDLGSCANNDLNRMLV